MLTDPWGGIWTPAPTIEMRQVTCSRPSCSCNGAKGWVSADYNGFWFCNVVPEPAPVEPPIPAAHEPSSQADGFVEADSIDHHSFDNSETHICNALCIRKATNRTDNDPDLLDMFNDALGG